METKKLKATLRETEKELKILREITQAICSLDLDRILRKIFETATKLTKADLCSIYLFDDEGRELRLASPENAPAHNLRDRLAVKGEAVKWFKKKTPLAVSKDASGHARFKFFYDSLETPYEAMLSLPIISEDRVIGIINVLHQGRHRHTNHEISLLSRLTPYIGSAVESAKAYSEARDKERQLEVLSKISGMIVSNRYLKEILELIVTMTAQVMNSKICSIMLLDEQKQELFIGATQSLSKDYIKKPPLKVGQSISGLAVENVAPITVLDVTEEPRYMYREIAKKEGIVSMLSVPMKARERVIGVINSYTSYRHEFTAGETKMLQAVADQAAAAIENTNLMQEMLKAKEALEVRKVVEKAKGTLMEQLNIREDDAYRMMRKKSMDSRKTMKEVAESIILYSEMRKET
jgi:signal transduction protein with GAF and PtsI domain